MAKNIFYWSQNEGFINARMKIMIIAFCNHLVRMDKPVNDPFVCTVVLGYMVSELR